MPTENLRPGTANDDGIELNDDQLDRVAGGRKPTSPPPINTPIVHSNDPCDGGE